MRFAANILSPVTAFCLFGSGSDWAPRQKHFDQPIVEKAWSPTASRIAARERYSLRRKKEAGTRSQETIATKTARAISFQKSLETAHIILRSAPSAPKCFAQTVRWNSRQRDTGVVASLTERAYTPSRLRDGLQAPGNAHIIRRPGNRPLATEPLRSQK